MSDTADQLADRPAGAAAEGSGWAPPSAADPAASPSSEASDDAVSPTHVRVDPAPIEAALASVDDAIERLESGAYGRCDVCGDRLPDEVLDADPTARFCSGHLPGTLR